MKTARTNESAITMTDFSPTHPAPQQTKEIMDHGYK